jgi:hypothetical protein
MVYGLPFVRAVQRGVQFAAEPFVAINVDTSIQLQRAPIGEWLGLDAEVCYGPDGAGVGRASLADTDGALGFAQQSLLLRDAEAHPTEWESDEKRAAAPRAKKQRSR